MFVAPAAAARAVVSIAAGGAGISRVLDALVVSVAAVAAQVFLDLVIRNGAAGVGPIVFQQVFKVVTANTVQIDLDGLNLIGSANTALAVEFLTAPAATNLQRIYASGYNILT